MDEERARALLGEERQRLERLLASVEADHERVTPGRRGRCRRHFVMRQRERGASVPFRVLVDGELPATTTGSTSANRAMEPCFNRGCIS
jgi:hypothetical protein